MDILVKREVAKRMLGPFQVESISESPYWINLQPLFLLTGHMPQMS